MAVPLHYYIRLWIIACLCTMPISSPAMSHQLLHVDTVTHPKYTEVVMTFSAQPHYHVVHLHHPNRLVIDCDNTQMAPSVHLPSTPKPIKSLRHAQHQKKLRTVFDLDNRLSHISIHPKGKQQLLIHLGLMTPQPKRNMVIVIDPGHGGSDPGASGSHGIQEKSIALSIAKKLQEQLNTQTGFHALLTRKGDYFVSLRHRLDLARQYHADLFIAIHADAYFHHRAHGASIYALSERGATSEAARWLAQKENHSELAGASLSNTDTGLRSVLINLQQTACIRASLKIGNTLLNTLRPLTHLHHEKVEQAAFVVLKSPDIPSLLIETGFLSHHGEAKKLHSARYQNQLAHAIAQGIVAYFSSVT